MLRGDFGRDLSDAVVESLGQEEDLGVETESSDALDPK
jgi:hypothetical protein